jgi:hypothetical protein
MKGGIIPAFFINNENFLSCALGPQEKTVRKLARESVMRKLNHCNIQLVGTESEPFELLKELENQPNLKKEWRDYQRNHSEN